MHGKNYIVTVSIADKEPDILLKVSLHYLQYVSGAMQYTESIQPILIEVKILQTKMTPAFAPKQQKRRGFVVNDQSGRIIVT